MFVLLRALLLNNQALCNQLVGYLAQQHTEKIGPHIINVAEQHCGHCLNTFGRTHLEKHYFKAFTWIEYPERCSCTGTNVLLV